MSEVGFPRRIEVQTDKYGVVKHVYIDDVEDHAVESIEVVSSAANRMSKVKVTYFATMTWHAVDE